MWRIILITKNGNDFMNVLEKLERKRERERERALLCYNVHNYTYNVYKLNSTLHTPYTLSATWENCAMATSVTACWITFLAVVTTWKIPVIIISIMLLLTYACNQSSPSLTSLHVHIHDINLSINYTNYITNFVWH